MNQLFLEKTEKSNAALILDKIISPALKFYVFSSTWLNAWGFLLDKTNHLDNRFLWLLSWLLLGIFGIIFLRIDKPNLTELKLLKINFLIKKIIQINVGAKILLLTTAIVTGINLLCALILYPHNWDSMTYHLTCIMYFIQHKNTSFFDANYWAQVIYPAYSYYLKIAFFMLFNEERNMMFVQYFAGIFAAVSVIGVSLLISGMAIASLLSGCIFLILTNVNLQMTTSQNDLLMASFLGCSIYFFCSWIRERKIILAFYSWLSFVICIGIKANAFLYFIPMIALVISYLYLSGSIRKIYHLFILFPLMIVVFWTSGYYENLILFGSAFGPPNVINEHSLQNRQLSTIVTVGLENLVRFSSRFFSLDGLPDINLIRKIHVIMQLLIIYPFKQMGINVHNTEGTRIQFVVDKPMAHEDLSYLGILGFSVLWPLVFLSFFHKKLRTFIPLSLGAVFFLLSQSFATLYDPWRGRAFIAIAIFMVPLSTIIWQWNHKNRVFSFLLTLVIIVSSFSAFTTLAFRVNRNLVPYKDNPSVWRMDRIEQLTAHRKELTEPLKKVSDWIDKYPNLPLYTVLPEDFYEYPLFRGNEIIPLNGFVSGFQSSKLNSIKQGILFYSGDIYSDYQIGDIKFGENLFGRVINH